MKSLMITLLFIVPSLAQAHCPIALDIAGDKFCTAIEWLNAEQKIQGQLKPSSHPSPQMVIMGTPPPKWLYSKVQFKIWKDGDGNHIPQKISNLTIFPYMFMEGGHHHSTSFDFVWDENAKAYSLESVAFLEMPGCWNLRYTTSGVIDVKGSQSMFTITSYNNLSDKENKQVKVYCHSLSQDSVNQSQGSGAHEHHH